MMIMCCLLLCVYKKKFDFNFTVVVVVFIVFIFINLVKISHEYTKKIKCLILPYCIVIKSRKLYLKAICRLQHRTVLQKYKKYV